MKKFILRFFLFFLPLALFMFPAIYHLEKNREISSVETMATGSITQGSLIGLAYTDPMHLVKHAVVAKRQPDVIALGTSRVLSFRSFCFANPYGFYNCGRSVEKIQDLRAFIESYPGKKPKVILLGLDQDFFGDNTGDTDSPPRDYGVEDSNYGSRIVKGVKAFYETFGDEGLVTGDAMPGTELFFGRNARLYYEGYRTDGSYLYGRTLRTEDDYLFASTVVRIDKGEGRFEPADRIGSEAVAELERFVEVCAGEGIHLVPFLPPYASRVYDRLLEERGSYPHVFSLHAELSPVFEKRGLRLFDFSDLRSVASNDYETYDGFHASEIAYLKMIAIMAAGDSVLDDELDRSRVTELLSNPYSARQLVEEAEEKYPQTPD